VFGDWYALGRTTSDALVGTTWFARSAATAAAIAHALGDADAERRFTALHADVRAAFQARFVTDDGRVESGTQTAYALALDADLVPGVLRAEAARHLVSEVEEHGWHLTTGFAGTACVLQALSDTGHTDVAYRLLLQTSYPSWGAMLRNGATAVWEHWDAWRPETGFHDPNMNSLNHFAFATVGRFLYRHVAGINPDPARPGYQRVRFAPRPDPSLREVRAVLDTPSGRVAAGWWSDGRSVRLTVEVPPNADGVLDVPWAVDGPAELLGPGIHTVVLGLTPKVRPRAAARSTAARRARG
jgi:alpha-L-rhamnosidase